MHVTGGKCNVICTNISAPQTAVMGELVVTLLKAHSMDLQLLNLRYELLGTIN